jgi:hypothetical protein
VNTNAKGGWWQSSGRGAVWEMEVCWPSRAALRGEALNHPELHWLKTVVVSVVGKGVARPRQVRSGKMGDGRKPSVVDVSKRGQTRSKPRSQNNLGTSPGDTRLLPGWSPAYRRHEPGPGSRMERVKACPDTAVERSGERESSKRRIREERSTDAGRAGGLARSSCEVPAYRSGGGAKGRGRPGERMRSTGKGGTA